MTTEERIRYFGELALNLQQEGFIAGPESDDLLAVELEGRRLCLATESGGVRYRQSDVSGEARSGALDKVRGIAEITAGYMRQMEAAPQLTASSLSGDYRLLAEFNGAVLAGHSTKYGTQFITWNRAQDQTALAQGNYYGPGNGVKDYTAAKQDFAIRSGLIPQDALFTPEQLTEVYRCVLETLDCAYLLTDKRRNLLESAAKQIEYGVPDLEERVSLSTQQEQELDTANGQDQSGMQFR